MSQHASTNPTITTERVKAFSTLAGSLVLTVNAVLALAGWNPLPFTDSEAGTAVSTVLMLGMNMYAWWKNQNVTKAAVSASQTLKVVKTLPVTEESPAANVDSDETAAVISLESANGFADISETA